MNVQAGPKPESFLCQPTMVVNQACNQEFSGQSSFLEIKPLRETFQLQQKKQKTSWGKIWIFFHLGTPKTAFLMKNLLIDPRNMDIFPYKQGHSFQFPKKSRGGPPPPWWFVPADIIYDFYVSFQKCPLSLQNIWLLFWMEGVKYSEPRKTNFVNELTEV